MRELKLFVETVYLRHSNEWDVEIVLSTGPSGKRLTIFSDKIGATFYPDPDVFVAAKLANLLEYS